jgi:hypothetical protein
MDPIRSHFRSSYSLALKLIETREMRACQGLVEKSFGSFVVQERINKRLLEAEASSKFVSAQGSPSLQAAGDPDAHREVLNKYTLQGARNFWKIEKGGLCSQF